MFNPTMSDKGEEEEVEEQENLNRIPLMTYDKL